MDEYSPNYTGADVLMVEPLTDRELDILRLLAEGRSNQQIADDLHLALTTVKWHNTQIFGKLGADSRRRAVERARELGLLGEPIEEAARARALLPRLKPTIVGRQAELARLEQLVRSGTQLITLLAPGGMGKTTVALMAAHRLRPNFRDGAHFVPLASVRTSAQIITTIAEHLGFQFRPDSEPLRHQLLEFLAGQHLLLVLDNFEHLLDDALLLSDLVEAAPHVAVLVTSRERLNLTQETVFLLGGLGCRDQEVTEGQEHQHEAVQLFVQRCRYLQPDYELSAADAKHVIQICHLVGGMPLALELAAGWVGILSLDEIIVGLRQGIDILETDMRDVPERQRSMRAVLDSAWMQLSEAERAAFVNLSVLENSFDAAAAEVVGGADPRILRQLIHRGLVGALPSGRHTIHELLRQYGAEKLLSAGSLNAARERHARYYADFLRRVYTGPYSFRSPASLAALERELENVLAAWRYMTSVRLFEFIPFTVDCLGEYIHASARYFEGQQWLSEGLDALQKAPDRPPTPPGILGHVLAQLGNFLVSIDTAQALSLLQEAIRVLKPLGPSLPLMKAYLSYADYHCFLLSDEVERDMAMQTACDIAAQIGDPLHLANALALRAMTAIGHGDLATAEASGTEAHQLAEAYGAEPILAVAKCVLGGVHSALQDYEGALRYLEDALTLNADTEHVYTLAGIHIEIASVYRQQGSLDLARDHMREALRVHLLFAEDWQTVGVIYSIAREWFMNLGRRERAVELLAFTYHHPLATVTKEPARICLGELEAALDPDIFAATFERGRAAKLPDVIDDLLMELSA